VPCAVTRPNLRQNRERQRREVAEHKGEILSLLDILPIVAFQYVERLGERRMMAPLENADLLQGTLDMLILKVVALGPLHGYGISQRIRQMSNEVLNVQQGSLYPALHRLEKRGWLVAEWGESENGREAKFYQLSREGRRQLSKEEATWERMAEAVRLILGAAAQEG
jgi:PadR family transcriptional regulator, regulatory protein PadR